MLGDEPSHPSRTFRATQATGQQVGQVGIEPTTKGL